MNSFQTWWEKEANLNRQIDEYGIAQQSYRAGLKYAVSIAMREAAVLEKFEIAKAGGGGVLHSPDVLKWRKIAAFLGIEADKLAG